MQLILESYDMHLQQSCTLISIQKDPCFYGFLTESHGTSNVCSLYGMVSWLCAWPSRSCTAMLRTEHNFSHRIPSAPTIPCNGPLFQISQAGEIPPEFLRPSFCDLSDAQVAPQHHQAIQRRLLSMRTPCRNSTNFLHRQLNPHINAETSQALAQGTPFGIPTICIPKQMFLSTFQSVLSAI